MVEVDLTKFHKKLAERRKKQEEAEKAAQEAAPEFSEDLVPEEIFERSEADEEIDYILGNLSILDAYRRWCNKMTPVVRTGQTEGIMVSCPIPGHIDSNPSAWINLDKQTWFCGGCQEGGDKYDIAAYWTGFSVPGYKEGAEFHRLRERMLEDLGYQIHKLPQNQVAIIPPEDEDDDVRYVPTNLSSSELSTVADTRAELIAEVINLNDDEDDWEDQIEIPKLNWRTVCPEGTFLHSYMTATIIDDVPEEYHFFHGLIALGFALGREVTLWDTVPIYANLFVCTLGRTGSGKSKARKHLDRLLYEAMPYDRTFVPSKGVLRVNAPGSAEALIAQFMEPVPDPTNPKRIAYFAPVKGIIDFNELSALVGRTNRQGSVMKPALMQFYDMDERIQTVSLSSGNKIAEKPFASCLTTSQPKALRQLISSADASSGFLNRWIFVPGTYKQRFSVGGAQVNIKPAIPPLQAIQAWSSTFGPGEQVLWTEEALKLWDDFFHAKIEKDQMNNFANDVELIGRIDLTMKKLILLFTANKQERTISQETVHDAINCYPYLKASYSLPAGQIGRTEVDDLIAQIEHAVISLERKLNKPPSLREIRRKLGEAKWSKNREQYKKAMELMTDKNIGTLEVTISKSGGKVGRPTARYRYVGMEKE